MKNYKLTPYTKIGVFFTIAMSLFFGCEIQDGFSYKESNSNKPLGVTAWQYIQTHDSLNLLQEAIKLTNTQDLYEASTGKTFIAPTNEAFKEYLQNNTYQSLSEVPVPILRNALKYHVVNAYVSFDDPDLMESNNPIAYTSQNGQTIFLSHRSNFTGVVNEGTSKQWEIVTSNLKALNGVIHVVPSIVYFSALSSGSEGPDPTVVRDTIFPIADAYVNGGSRSSQNFGADPLLKLKNVTGNGGYDRKSFLMYDLNDFTKDGVIVDLKLEIAVKFTAAKGIDLDVYNVKDTLWTELGLTFDNATLPTTSPVSRITSRKISTFEFDMTDYYKSLDYNGRISLMIDQEAGRDETDEFHSKENTGGFNPPMLIARFASGDTVLSIDKNTGFSVENGEAYVFSNTILQVSGSPAGDVKFIIKEAPQYGWLIRGASILKVGDSFTQEDVDVMNLLYIHNGIGSSDKIVVSAEDKAGASLNNFEIVVTVQ
ncbi:CBM96 family carbohydrate-binding protein [Gelidibacter salicanalis]|uniref:DNRLRE domain-containing protein n=1 Tax=Gelidibacter salicanalis TaxID=291193 RepID=A0A934NKP4_9FLAO|nr:DNRLRE domain-containing protein [Gelidibacter salicanalis]MBJ7881657.1 DNRLRE domain-containing protein [Gelidibacter salicanalis]